MGWESRNGRGRYYTRSRRVNGRVVREYVGSGPIAELIARVDEIKRDKRDLARMDARAKRDDLDELDRLVADFDRQVRSVVREALQSAGYHQHDRGAWRKRRKRAED